MLLTCPSCNSKYLLNSADLKPDGKTVQCAKCDYEWFQESSFVNEEGLSPSVPPVFPKTTAENKAKELNNNIEEKITYVSNLPSTYVKDTESSIINSILVLVFLFSLIFILWLFKKEGSGILAFANFYLQEFYFNLKLIINDFAKIIYEILN